MKKRYDLYLYSIHAQGCTFEESFTNYRKCRARLRDWCRDDSPQSLKKLGWWEIKEFEISG